jgi:hypothetical protein
MIKFSFPEQHRFHWHHGLARLILLPAILLLVACAAPASAVPSTAGSTGSATLESTESAEKAIVRLTDTINVREHPSEFCQIIGKIDADTQIEVLAITSDGKWWKIPYQDKVGWIAVAFTEPVTDVSHVPVEDDQVCAPSSDAPPTSVSSAACGNGIVEAGEQCDQNCSVGFFCSSCQCVPRQAPPSQPVCGNGIVEAGEQCDGRCATGNQTCSGCQCVNLIP